MSGVPDWTSILNRRVTMKEPVETVTDLPVDADDGDAIFVKDESRHYDGRQAMFVHVDGKWERGPKIWRPS